LKNDLLYRFPDYGKAIEAAENISQLLDRKAVINNESKHGDEIVLRYCKYHPRCTNDIF